MDRLEGDQLKGDASGAGRRRKEEEEKQYIEEEQVVQVESRHSRAEWTTFTSLSVSSIPHTKKSDA